MAGYLVNDERKVTTHRFIEMKQKGEKISMLTSYDYTTAGIVDRAGIDGILVGDSASNVMAGNSTTLPITVDQMIYHAKAVTKAVKRALVVCDMPFGSYQINAAEGVTNAIRIMKESGCDALKMGPGDSERSHRADEYLLRSELEGAVEKYIDFIGTLYGNTLE